MDDPRLASSRLHADISRLRAQATLSWSREIEVLSRLGLRDGMSILEVGSGPGFITELLLRTLPHCSVTAVELDPEMMDVACERLGHDERVELVHASILNTDLPHAAFDFALARLVLQHLAAPDLALLEILRVLKPGGMLAVFDIDDAIGGLVSPHMPAFDTIAQRVREVQASRSGDREIGRKLWRLLSAAGYTDVGLEVLVFHSDELGLAPFLAQYRPERYQLFVASGGVTEEELEAYRLAYEEFVKSTDAFIFQLMLLAHGRKPLHAGWESE